MDESTRGREGREGATADDPIFIHREARLCQRGLDLGRHILFLSTAERRLQKVFVGS